MKPDWTIIVAEDEAGLNRLICRQLEKSGYQAVSALSGAQAIARTLEHDRALLLLDYVLPDMKAGDVVQALAEQGRAQPFVMMTGRGDETVAVEMMKQGARDYLIKTPGFIELLPNVLRRVLKALELEERVRESETARRESEERYRRLFANAVEGIYLATPAGKFISVNPALARMLGFDTPEDAIASVADIGAQLYVDPAQRREYQRQLDETGLIKGLEAQLRRNDGKTIWVTIDATVANDPATNEPFDQGSIVDITELKLARERERHELETKAFLSDMAMEFVRLGSEEDIYALILRKLRQLENDACVIVNSYDPKRDEFCVRASEGADPALNQVLEMMGRGPVGAVFALTEAQKEVYRSNRLTRLTGGLQELSFGKFPAALSSVLESTFNLGDTWAMTLFRGGEILGRVNIIVHGGSSLQNPDLVESLIDEASVFLLRRLAEDELKQGRDHLQGELTERTRQLKEARNELAWKTRMAALGQVADSVAHEMLSPLGVIRNGVTFLNLTVKDKLEGEPARHLEVMNQETDKATAIITSLLDFARGQMPERKSTRLDHIIAEALAQAALPPGVAVGQSIPPDLPMVEVDPKQMIHVFRNVLDNVNQALNGKGRVSIAVEPAGDFVRVSVADNGPGIRREHLPRVFEPLFSTRVAGVGLGLTIAKSYVEANQGAIEVRSEEGKGATVIVMLPCAPQSNASGL
jgi:PAS domain S-box-containing protein